jgi:3-methyladenine DNA glycosylase/8-oxoguanine DNA glycosylase
VRDERLEFGPGRGLDEFVDRFVACTGMSHSTAHLVAWRALGDPDAWPLEASGSNGPAAADLARLSTAWRPWRGYAALHLGMSLAPDEPATPRSRRVVGASEAFS